MEKKKRIDYSIFIYIVFFVVSVWPLTRDYILDGTDVTYWVERIEDVQSGLSCGDFRIMPSQHVLASHWGEATGINTNLWLFIPALINFAGVSMVDSYKIFMLGCNLVTVIGAVWMMKALTEKRIAVVTGASLLVLCPYRVYVCYDQPDLGKVVAWMLLPIVAGCLIRMVQGSKPILYVVMYVVSVGGMFYADVMVALLVAGISMLVILWNKKWMLLFLPLVGSALFLPGGISFVRYIIRGVYIENYLPQDSIMGKGYALGNMLSSYAYEADKPGLGIGIMVALFLLIWLVWCEEKKVRKNWMFPFSVLTLLCVLACTRYFPWDYVMRLGTPFLRLIGLLENTTVFLGLSGVLLSVWGVYGVELAAEKENEFVAWIVPVAINAVTIGVYYYLCSSLMDTRLPLYF